MKRFLYAMLAFLLLFSLTGCGYGHIKDQNGDENYSLCVLTEADLKAENPLCFEVGSIKRFSSGKDGISFGLKTAKLSGIKKCFSFTVKEGFGYRLDVNATISAGNIAVYVLFGGEIVRYFGIGEKDSFVADEVGSYSLMVAGERAAFEIEANASESSANS